MKRTRSLILILFLLAAVFTYAKDAGKKKTLKGYLVDIACRTERMAEGVELGPKHTKGCLQMPACERSGYGVLTKEDRLYRFDAAGNEQAKLLMAATDRDRDWKVTVKGRVLEDQIAVSRLQMRD